MGIHVLFSSTFFASAIVWKMSSTSLCSLSRYSKRMCTLHSALQSEKFLLHFDHAKNKSFYYIFFFPFWFCCIDHSPFGQQILLLNALSTELSSFFIIVEWSMLWHDCERHLDMYQRNIQWSMFMCMLIEYSCIISHIRVQYAEKSRFNDYVTEMVTIKWYSVNLRVHPPTPNDF